MRHDNKDEIAGEENTDSEEIELTEISNFQKSKLKNRSFAITARIYHAYEPTTYGLSFYSYADIVYELLRLIPGLGRNMNIPYLIFTLTAIPFFVALKLVEKITKFPWLEKITHFLQGIDSFPSSLFFNLQTYGAIAQTVVSKQHNDQYTETDDSDSVTAGIILSLAVISLFVTLSALGVYHWLEKKFSNYKFLSSSFKYVDIAASFTENFIKLTAVGRMVVGLFTTFPLGGINETDDPQKWFYAQILPCWLLSFPVAGLLTYTTHRKNSLSFLGNQEQRQYIIECLRMVLTAIAVTGNYWITAYEISEEPEQANITHPLIYLSGIAIAILIGLPLLFLMLFLPIKNYCCTKNSRFEILPDLQQPFLEAGQNSEEPSEDQPSEALWKDEDDDAFRMPVVDPSYANQGWCSSFRLPPWLPFFGSAESKLQLVEPEVEFKMQNLKTKQS